MPAALSELRAKRKSGRWSSGKSSARPARTRCVTSALAAATTASHAKRCSSLVAPSWTFYDFKIAIAPTAYEFAAGHRLQLRLTSYNMPNALPGTIDFNGSEPANSSFVPLPPATNSVRYGGTSLLLPVSTGASP
jgi:predicted acyl esterase